jgi:hypothetical protein
MVGSAAAVRACARAVDAGRRGTKGHSACCTGPFVPWRSGATERVQACTAVVESAIYHARAAPEGAARVPKTSAL